jgi:hypothetical protein
MNCFADELNVICPHFLRLLPIESLPKLEHQKPSEQFFSSREKFTFDERSLKDTKDKKKRKLDGKIALTVKRKKKNAKNFIKRRKSHKCEITFKAA